MRHVDPDEHRPAPGGRSRAALLAIGAFTLVELMVVLAIAAILLAAAMPDFRATLERLALRAAATDLLAALHLARSQAIGRGETIVVAPFDAGGARWAEGWIVFADRDGDGRPGAGEPVLFRHGAGPDGLAVETRLTLPAPPWYVAYNSAGRSCRAGNALAASWGTLALRLGGTRRNIKINMLGRARLCDPAREAGCDTSGE